MLSVDVNVALHVTVTFWSTMHLEYHIIIPITLYFETGAIKNLPAVLQI